MGPIQMTLWSIASRIAPLIIDNLVPKLREDLEEFLQGFYKRAVASEGLLDDVIARFLLALIGSEPKE